MTTLINVNRCFQQNSTMIRSNPDGFTENNKKLGENHTWAAGRSSKTYSLKYTRRLWSKCAWASLRAAAFCSIISLSSKGSAFMDNKDCAWCKNCKMECTSSLGSALIHFTIWAQWNVPTPLVMDWEPATTGYRKFNAPVEQVRTPSWSTRYCPSFRSRTEHQSHSLSFLRACSCSLQTLPVDS